MDTANIDPATTGTATTGTATIEGVTDSSDWPAQPSEGQPSDGQPSYRQAGYGQGGYPVTAAQWIRQNRVVTQAATLPVMFGGVGFLVCTRTVFGGLAGSLYCLFFALALVVSRTVNPRRSEPMVWLLFAVVLGAFLTVRASPWLITLNTIGIWLFFTLAALTARRGSIFRITRRGIRDGLGVLAFGPFATVPIVGNAVANVIKRLVEPNRGSAAGHHEVSDGPTSRSTVAVMFRAGFLVSPVLVVVVPLLMAGDTLFRSLFTESGTVARIIESIATTVAGPNSLIFISGAWLSLVLVAIAGTPRLTRSTNHSSQRVGATNSPRAAVFGTRETTAALWILNAVLGLFALVQIVGAVGLADEMIGSTMSYREIAKDGFFALLAASAVVWCALLLAHGLLGSARWDARPRKATQTTVALTLVVVAVALRRLWVGADVWGLTMLRVLSQTAAILLGLMLLYLGRWQARPGHAFDVLGLSLVTGFTLLALLNVLPTEGIVVRWNAALPPADFSARFGTKEEVRERDWFGYEYGVARCADYYDKWHGQNPDAAPALAAVALKKAKQQVEVDRTCIRELLRCDASINTRNLRWNWSRNRLLSQRKEWCAEFPLIATPAPAVSSTTG
jgi:hypothetical protein